MYGQPHHQGKQGPRELLGFLRLQGMQHWLRLRKRLQLSDVASAELGVDLNLKNQRYMPHAALSYEVGAWGHAPSHLTMLVALHAGSVAMPSVAMPLM